MLCPYREAFCDAIQLKDVCPELSQLQKESALVDLTLRTQNGLILKVHRVIFAARLPKLKDFICTSTNSTIDWSRFPQRLSTSNINHIWDFALETGHQDIRLSCLDFMQKHFEAVVETRGFGTLSEDVLSHLISSDSLVVSREEQVVESIFKWAASACNQSNSSLAAPLPRLLSFVRWEEVSESYLSELLSRDRPQSIDSSCTKFLQSFKSPKTTEDDSVLRSYQLLRNRSRKCLFLVGEMFSPADEQWSVQTLDPISGVQGHFPAMGQRNASQLVALNGLAYVIGGQVNRKLSASVVEFNPKTGRWRRVASSLLARCGHAAAGFGCGIISCGGWNGRTAVGFAELFLPAKNRWFRLPDLLNARAAHRAVAHEEDGRIFVTGGEDEQGLALDLVEYCTLPNFITAGQAESHSFLTWRRAAPMNQKRKYHALAYVKGKIVAVGGYVGHQEVTRTVEVSDILRTTDPDDQIWTDLGRLSTVREVNGVVVLPSPFHSQTV
ncbi:unnamed protein product [Schistocephalus solidus]|uniref:BACK domain-containing protein n=1 Tax=Schistocephalus solidus TaxID=70667 RepID=A0A183SQH7_SCHSO|nr:unnamed protein product [Schistocephalus solidus]